MEHWKQLIRWESIYEISDLGRIRRVDGNNCAKVGYILKPIYLDSGYTSIRLRYKGRTERKLIHSYVMEAFVGERPNGYEINHINGNRSDNRLCNLEYCTPSQNKLHSYNILGRKPSSARGEANAKSKLTEYQVTTIRRLYSGGGVSQQSIANQYGITQNMVSKIVLKQCWKHLPQ